MSSRILATLSTTVKNALEKQREIESVNLWLDSKTELFWIENRGEWKQFVKNGFDVALTTINQWRYCPTSYNPVDIGTRGIKTCELTNNSFWRHCWLKQEKNGCTEEAEQEILVHVGAVKMKPNTGIHKVLDISRFSNEAKLYQVTAWVMRLLINLVTVKEEQVRTNCELLAEEVIAAQKMWIKCAQYEMVSEAKFDQLKNQLTVVKDKDGIYRCHGRLVNSDLHMDAKQPILLPRQHHLTKLVVDSCCKCVIHVVYK